jgi:hypothetical protein
MKKNNKKMIDDAKESLVDILRRIEPYMPKTPQEKTEKPKEWRPVDTHVFPPMPSLRHPRLI